MSRRGISVVGIVVAVVVGVVAWRLVTAPDLSPVPPVAQGPYLCDGVPREGAELILGGAVEVTRNVGDWGSDERSFACIIERGEGLITVYEEPIERSYPTVALWADHNEGMEWFDVDAPGQGYVTLDDPGVAEWACGNRLVRVVISSIAPGRDKKADVITYLTSMLPWACGDTEPPDADTSS